MKNKIFAIIGVVFLFSVLVVTTIVPVAATSVAPAGATVVTQDVEKFNINSINYSYGGYDYIIDGGTGFAYTWDGDPIYSDRTNVVFGDIQSAYQNIYDEPYWVIKDYTDTRFPMQFYNYFALHSNWQTLTYNGGTYGYYIPSIYNNWNSTDWLQYNVPYSSDGNYILNFTLIYTNSLNTNPILPADSVSIMLKSPNGETFFYTLPYYVLSIAQSQGYNFVDVNGNVSNTVINVSLDIDYTNNDYTISIIDLNNTVAYTDVKSFPNDYYGNGVMSIRYVHPEGYSVNHNCTSFGFYDFELTKVLDVNDNYNALFGVNIQNIIKSAYSDYPDITVHETIYTPFGSSMSNVFDYNTINFLFNDFTWDIGSLMGGYDNFNQMGLILPCQFDTNITFDLTTINTTTGQSIVNNVNISPSDIASNTDYYSVSNDYSTLIIAPLLFDTIRDITNATYVGVSNLSISVTALDDCSYIKYYSLLLAPQAFDNYEQFIIYYTNINYQENLNDFNLGDFLVDSVGGFMNFSIIPGVSIGGLVAIFLSMSLIFVFLRYFAG